MTRSRWFRAGLFLLIGLLLITSGAAHASMHAHGDHGPGHDHGEHHATVDGAHGGCVACHLDLSEWTPPRLVLSHVTDVRIAREAGPESPHASSLRGRAAPRAPPVRA